MSGEAIFFLTGYAIALFAVLIVYPIVSAVVIGNTPKLARDEKIDDWFGATAWPAFCIAVCWWIVIPLAIIIAIPVGIFLGVAKILVSRPEES